MKSVQTVRTKKSSMSRDVRRVRAARVIKALKKLYPTVRSMLTFHHDRPYEFLFAVIMSAQTTDAQVNKVTHELFKKYMSLDDYVHADAASFEKDISSIGLYRGKAKNILASAKLLMLRHNGHIPKTLTELIMLPGVGRKTANVVLGHLHGLAEGIAVDTHMIRLCQKYQLTYYHDAKMIEADLMQIIPQSEWVGFTNRMIWYGREHCPAHCKSCPSCPLWSEV